ncbi:uncharacterized protein [Oscarella lobularis]|uniref:uncharacterized protein isoform X2 n=1 Tax=Oscarella lobularis TaxID=121494 RepID=UPI0033132727
MQDSGGEGPRRRRRRRRDYAFLDDESILLLEKLNATAPAAASTISKLPMSKIRDQQFHLKYLRAIRYYEARLALTSLLNWHAICQSRAAVAKQIYARSLLKKGMDALAWAVRKSRQKKNSFSMIAAEKLKRRAFSSVPNSNKRLSRLYPPPKWHRKWSERRQERREETFFHWKRLTLLKVKLKHFIYVKSFDISGQVFGRWKIACGRKIQCRVASQYYDKKSLSRCFLQWRSKSVTSREKENESDDMKKRRILLSYFTTMRRLLHKSIIADCHQRMVLMRKMFCGWTCWSLLSRIEREKRENSCVLFRQFHLLRNFWKLWKEMYKNRIAQQFRRRRLRILTFRHWKVESQSKCQLRRRWHHFRENNVKKRFLLVWRTARAKQRDERTHDANRIDCFLQWKCLRAWKRYVSQKIEERVNLKIQKSRRQIDVIKRSFSVWRRKLRRVSVKKNERAGNAYFLWRRMVFVRRLDELFHIKLSLNQREKLRACFGFWVRLFRLRANLSKIQTSKRDQIARKTFLKWKRLAEMMPTIKQKTTRLLKEKVFEKWRKMTKRRKSLQIQLECSFQFRLKMFFRKWRKNVVKETLVRRSVMTNNSKLLQMAFSRWRAHVCTAKKESHFRRGLQRRNVQRCFVYWRKRQEEAKRNCLAIKARKELLLSTFFAKWHHEACSSKHRNELLLKTSLSYYTKISLKKATKKWKLILKVKQLHRNACYKAGQSLLKLAFNRWHHFVQTEISREISFFELSLLTKSSSTASSVTGTVRKRSLALQLIAHLRMGPTAVEAFYAWLDLVQEKKDANFAVERLLQDSSLHATRRGYVVWKRELHKIRKARRFHRHCELKRHFASWTMYLYIRHEKKQTLARAIAFHRKQLVVTQLNKWRRMFRLRESSRIMLRFWARWSREEKIVRDVTRRRHESIQLTHFLLWQKAYRVAFKVKRFREASENRTSVRIWSVWRIQRRKVAVERKVVASLLGAQRARHLRIVWNTWKAKYYHTLAEKLNSRVILQRSFSFWKDVFIREKKTLVPHPLERFYFRKWIAAWLKRTSATVLAQTFFQQKLLRKCVEKWQRSNQTAQDSTVLRLRLFVHWRHHAILVSHERKRNTKCLAQSWRRWCQRFDINQTAKTLNRHTTIASFWQRWRIAFARSRAVRKVEHFEEVTFLRKILSAWKAECKGRRRERKRDPANPLLRAAFVRWRNGITY